MPALWPKFIPELANTLTSQQFTKPGGMGISYPKPEQVSEIGNPLNAALKSNQADYINAFDPNPLSGRYDFGKQVAQHYLDAVKNLAMTHVGAVHINNPAAELILKEGYGIAFERLLREGDLPLFDQYDEEGNLIEMGKESHPAYADFCPTEEETKGPDLEELEKENDAAFNKFVEEAKDEYDLHRFRFFHFPCLSGNETQEELEQIFASRLLQQFEKITNKNTKWEFYIWLACLGSENYSNSSGFGGSWSGLPYPNINTTARNDIEDAGYNWKDLADNVSKLCIDAIHEVHPEDEENTWTFFNTAHLKQRIQKNPTGAITLPYELECPLNEYKIQVAFDFENTEDYPSPRPKILTSNVVATFSWYPGVRSGIFTANAEGVVTNAPKFIKSKNWVKNKYEKDEWEKKWRKVPENKLKAASKKADAQKAFFQINPKPEGTLFKYEYHRALCAKKAADACEEDLAEVPHPWEPSGSTPGGKTYSGDPYMMMARVTIAYWYACIVKPFQPVTPAPPALIPPPLTGIYIPIYYGSANRLANNLRRAWNTGKSFKVPGTQQPASMATATAVAGAYAMHLLEFKLLYLGGIPTPVGPVPMVGFVPVVF
jgi:hypothetical protein